MRPRLDHAAARQEPRRDAVPATDLAPVRAAERRRDPLSVERAHDPRGLGAAVDLRAHDVLGHGGEELRLSGGEAAAGDDGPGRVPLAGLSAAATSSSRRRGPCGEYVIVSDVAADVPAEEADPQPTRTAAAAARASAPRMPRQGTRAHAEPVDPYDATPGSTALLSTRPEFSLLRAGTVAACRPRTRPVTGRPTR